MTNLQYLRIRTKRNKFKKCKLSLNYFRIITGPYNSIYNKGELSCSMNEYRKRRRTSMNDLQNAFNPWKYFLRNLQL